MNVWKLRLWASLSDYLAILCIIQPFSTKTGNAFFRPSLTYASIWLTPHAVFIDLASMFLSCFQLSLSMFICLFRFCCRCLTFDLLIFLFVCPLILWSSWVWRLHFNLYNRTNYSTKVISHLQTCTNMCEAQCVPRNVNGESQSYNL